jgi:ankyrin repeat protein
LCQALNFPEELALQYHDFNTESYSSKYVHSSDGYLLVKIYDYDNRKVVNPHLAKALLKNVKFQSIAKGNWKAAYAILSQDLELVRDSLKDPTVDHQGKVSDYIGPYWSDESGCRNWVCPFEVACEFGQLDAAKLLANQYGIDVSVHDNTALIRACRQGFVDIVKYITSHPDFNPVNCAKAFIEAKGNVDVVRLLLSEPRVNPADQNNRAIITAARYENAEIVKLLMSDPRVNPADGNNKALRNAAKIGHIEIVKLLMSDPRVNPADQNNRAIITAARYENAEIVKLLMSDPRVNPADQNNKALKYAAKRGHYEIFKLLIPADHRLELEACDQGHLNQTLDLLIQRFSDDYDDYDNDDIYNDYRDYEGFDWF